MLKFEKILNIFETHLEEKVQSFNSIPVQRFN